MYPEPLRALFQVFSYTTTLRKEEQFIQNHREVFDYFYGLKQFNFLFSEMKTDLENEIYDIYTIDIEHLALAHRFSYEISTIDKGNEGEIEQFMVFNPSRNKQEVGESCTQKRRKVLHCQAKQRNCWVGLGFTCQRYWKTALALRETSIQKNRHGRRYPQCATSLAQVKPMPVQHSLKFHAITSRLQIMS